jgi:DNA-binding response OmpR family regulator
MTLAASDTPRRTVLVVEDDPSIRELLQLHLALAGFDVSAAGDGRLALDLARSKRFDLLVLDVMLPHLDGITLCRALRTEGANAATPILMLTALDTESDKVLGLESGADDYLTKPFGIRELLARVGALLRRAERADGQAASTKSPGVVSREVRLDPERRQAWIRGEPVELTKQEFDLLHLLAARPGIVFSRAALLAKVWQGDTYVTERTVDTVVSRLRRKIEREPQDPALILTAWGVGYKFVDLEDRAE